MDYYYNDSGDIVYCYYGVLYQWDPDFWGIVGWTWYFNGICEEYQSVYYDSWWYDSWYSWADELMDYYYGNDNNIFYCYNNELYAWDPDFWGVPGWTWLWVPGNC
jgi:hypothetical protein